MASYAEIVKQGKILNESSPKLKAYTTNLLWKELELPYSEMLFDDSEEIEDFLGTIERKHSSDRNRWYNDYFDALAMPESTKKMKLKKYRALNSIHQDFVAAATSYAKTIISEFFLPHEHKTLRPFEIGGQGGVKYLLHGILFKLANGSRGPFENSDEFAAKAMGHEMKG
jgi:hypothetical protein